MVGICCTSAITMQFKVLEGKLFTERVKLSFTCNPSVLIVTASIITGTVPFAAAPWLATSCAIREVSDCDEYCGVQMAVCAKVLASIALICIGSVGEVPAVTPVPVYPAVAEVTPGIVLYFAVSPCTVRC